MKNMLTFINTHSIRMNCNQSRRWIESLNDERPTNSKKEFPLPKGEGQGEGEPRSVTQRRVIFSECPTESFRLKMLTSSAI